jgi:transposase-like protein
MTMRFTPETRAEAVRRVAEGEDIDALAQELDTMPMMVRRWITMAKNAQKKKSLMKVSAGALNKTSDAEDDDGKGDIARLRGKIAKLTRERDALKTLLAVYMADDS